MFIAVLFLPVVAGNVFTGNSPKRVPEVTERSWPPKTYTIFDPCNTHKPGGRAVSCSQLQMMGNKQSGVYVISPDNKNITVYCDMTTDGGGWTVIQRRVTYEKPEDNLFEKTDKEYEDGFGDVLGSLWIGNKNLHALTTHPNKKQALSIKMSNTSEGKDITVDYGAFQVGSKAESYVMNSDEYTGNQGYNAFAITKGRPFAIGNINSTYRDHSCYALRSGGWWSGYYCTVTNLNGRRRNPSHEKPTPTLDITWLKGHGSFAQPIFIFGLVEMKIRDADFEFCTGRRASYSL